MLGISSFSSTKGTTMTNYFPIDIHPEIYSPETRGAIKKLQDSSGLADSALLSTQKVCASATCNIDNGRLEFEDVVSPEFKPVIARALASDHKMRNLIKATLIDKDHGIPAPTFATVHFFAGAIGIHWNLWRCDNSDLDVYRQISRLLMPYSENANGLIKRRNSFDAILSAWTKQMSELGVDLQRLKPPHLDCLLTTNGSQADLPQHAGSNQYTHSSGLTAEHRRTFSLHTIGTVH